MGYVFHTESSWNSEFVWEVISVSPDQKVARVVVNAGSQDITEVRREDFM
jgi:hypothetical protein